MAGWHKDNSQSIGRTPLVRLNRVVDGAGATVDPIFRRDLGFFLFELPFLRLVQSILNGLLLGSLLLAGGRYLLAGLAGELRATTPIRVHLAFLVGLALLSVSAGYQLDKFELVYSTNGVATGVGFTDANARFLALDVLTAIAALAAAFLVGGAFTRMVWPLAATLPVWFVASLLLGSVYPELIQRFVVEPNQYAQEQPYIRNTISMTRLAYGLDRWERVPYGGEAPLTQAAVEAEQDTFRSARVWDYRPLRDVIDQVQTVRQYYDFTDVDTDRYTIDGVQRQVMLSARELAPERNAQATSWVNQRVTYTHGVGAVVVPVDEATPGGGPTLYVKDLPPTSVAGAPEISEFRIYFGERPSDWVLVGARQDEFDYPVGQAQDGSDTTQGRQTRFAGSTGIAIDSTLTRLLFAARLRDLNLLISDQVTSQSQLLFRRSLGERLREIAPFLRYDKDPYLVIRDDGSLAWIQDAYTTSDSYPYATAAGGVNYIRNSVKFVIDAYQGTTTAYLADADDPIAATHARIFPGLFKPLAEMPAALRTHVRYPEDIFAIQSAVFATFHMTQPAVFYNREDQWQVPSIDNGAEATLMQPYYTIMRLPGERQADRRVRAGRRVRRGRDDRQGRSDHRGARHDRDDERARSRLGEELRRLAQPPAVVSEHDLVNEVGGGNVLAHTERIEARIGGELFGDGMAGLFAHRRGECCGRERKGKWSFSAPSFSARQSSRALRPVTR